jgi:hypothetical protein
MLKNLFYRFVSAGNPRCYFRKFSPPIIIIAATSTASKMARCAFADIDGTIKYSKNTIAGKANMQWPTLSFLIARTILLR